MTDSEIMTATEASRGFSELLHRVCYGGESFVIKKGNRLMARITPVETEMQTSEMQNAEENSVAPIMDDAVPENITQEEAEFYRAWMEQVRNVPV